MQSSLLAMLTDFGEGAAAKAASIAALGKRVLPPEALWCPVHGLRNKEQVLTWREIQQVRQSK
jgi:hypothetical protein